jgi:hypothetical protein
MRNYGWEQYNKEHDEMVVKMQKISGAVLVAIGVLGVAFTGEGTLLLVQLFGVLLVMSKKSLS